MTTLVQSSYRGPKFTTRRTEALEDVAKSMADSIKSLPVDDMRAVLSDAHPDDAKLGVACMMSAPDRVRWLADCADRALPVGAARGMCQLAVTAAREWARDPISKHRKAVMVAADRCAMSYDPRQPNHIYAAVYSALAAIAPESTAISDAIVAANYAAKAAQDEATEHRWQIERAFHYIEKGVRP